MGFLKKLGYGLLAILAAVAIFVLLCALNPNLTKGISEILYGTDGNSGLIGSNTSVEVIAGSPALHTPAETGIPAADSGIDTSSLIPYTPYNGTITMIPENVLGRNGYTPVSGTGQELSESQAKAAEENIDKGSDSGTEKRRSGAHRNIFRTAEKGSAFGYHFQNIPINDDGNYKRCRHYSQQLLDGKHHKRAEFDFVINLVNEFH